MGFGLLALGYVFLNFYLVGADLIGYIIMLFALFKLKKIVPSFKKSIVSVFILIPVALFNLFGFVDTALDLDIMTNDDYIYSSQIDLTEMSDTLFSEEEEDVFDVESFDLEKEYFKDETEVVNGSTNQKKHGARVAEAIFNAIFIFGSLCFHWFFYKSIKELCIKTAATKLGFKADRNMYINIVFFCIWGLLTAGGGNVAIINIITIMHFVVLLLNFIYIFSCYATFAYESQVESDESEK